MRAAFFVLPLAAAFEAMERSITLGLWCLGNSERLDDLVTVTEAFASPPPATLEDVLLLRNVEQTNGLCDRLPASALSPNCPVDSSAFVWSVAIDLASPSLSVPLLVRKEDTCPGAMASAVLLQHAMMRRLQDHFYSLRCDAFSLQNTLEEEPMLTELQHLRVTMLMHARRHILRDLLLAYLADRPASLAKSSVILSRLLQPTQTFEVPELLFDVAAMGMARQFSSVTSIMNDAFSVFSLLLEDAYTQLHWPPHLRPTKVQIEHIPAAACRLEPLLMAEWSLMASRFISLDASSWHDFLVRIQNGQDGGEGFARSLPMLGHQIYLLALALWWQSLPRTTFHYGRFCMLLEQVVSVVRAAAVLFPVEFFKGQTFPLPAAVDVVQTGKASARVRELAILRAPVDPTACRPVIISPNRSTMYIFVRSSLPARWLQERITAVLAKSSKLRTPLAFLDALGG